MSLPELCIAVAPGRRGVGIGGVLLDALFVRGTATLNAICANVHVRNPSRHLYQRKGFRMVGQGRGPLGLAMRKDLRTHHVGGIRPDDEYRENLGPQNVGRRHGHDQGACCGGEFVVRGGQCVCLQLGQCDVFGLVGIRPVQRGGNAPCVVLQRSIAEQPDAQSTDAVENFAAGPFLDLAALH